MIRKSMFVFLTCGEVSLLPMRPSPASTALRKLMLEVLLPRPFDLGFLAARSIGCAKSRSCSPLFVEKVTPRSALAGTQRKETVQERSVGTQCHGISAGHNAVQCSRGASVLSLLALLTLFIAASDIGWLDAGSGRFSFAFSFSFVFSFVPGAFESRPMFWTEGDEFQPEGNKSIAAVTQGNLSTFGRRRVPTLLARLAAGPFGRLLTAARCGCEELLFLLLVLMLVLVVVSRLQQQGCRAAATAGQGTRTWRCSVSSNVSDASSALSSSSSALFLPRSLAFLALYCCCITVADLFISSSCFFSGVEWWYLQRAGRHVSVYTDIVCAVLTRGSINDVLMTYTSSSNSWLSTSSSCSVSSAAASCLSAIIAAIASETTAGSAARRTAAVGTKGA